MIFLFLNLTGWTVNYKLSYYSNIVFIKLYSMRKILLLGGKCLLFFYLYKQRNFIIEKILLTWREFAWLRGFNNLLPFIHQRLNVEHLISQFSTFNINKNSLSENRNIFHQWLVGFTDGDGTFSIVRQNNKWSLIFKLSQSTYNLRVLYFIKSQLGIGSIYVEKRNSFASFRIRDRFALESVIFPIFDKYSLLTTKQFNYIKFKEAYAVLSDTSLSNLEKDILIFKLINTKPPVNYISPVWWIVENKVSSFESASKVISKAWLVGFTEAKGSFYLVAKSNTRLVHAFEITQKLDQIVLIAIKSLLGISTNVILKKAGRYTIITTNSRAIENIIKYYKNTMKGIKSVEYRIWARSYVKHKGDFVTLNKIRNNVRIMRT